MGRFRDWLIRKLGGVTAGDHEAFRVQCRDFADRHLSGKDYTLRTDDSIGCLVNASDSIADAAMVGDRITVQMMSEYRLLVAPWCRNVSVLASFAGCWATPERAGRE